MHRKTFSWVVPTTKMVLDENLKQKRFHHMKISRSTVYPSIAIVLSCSQLHELSIQQLCQARWLRHVNTYSHVQTLFGKIDKATELILLCPRRLCSMCQPDYSTQIQGGLGACTSPPPPPSREILKSQML